MPQVVRGSWEEVHSYQERGPRHAVGRRGRTAANATRPEDLKRLDAEYKNYDPDGKKALELAKKYGA
jgi:hypothetical protein